MAVPKKKTSKSKRNMRRSHLALGQINLAIDLHTGEYKRPHHMASDGTYKGRQVIIKKVESDKES